MQNYLVLYAYIFLQSNAYSDESEQARLASSTGIIAYDNQTFADTHL